MIELSKEIKFAVTEYTFNLDEVPCDQYEILYFSVVMWG